MSPQLFCVVFEFVFVLLYLPHQRQKRVIVLLLIQLLRKEGHDVDVGLFFDFDNDIESFFIFGGWESDFYGINGD